MKTRNKAVYVLAALLIMALMGCAGAQKQSVVSTAYKSLLTAKTGYDAAMKAAASYYADMPEGVKKEEFKALVIAAALKFYDAYMVCQAALEKGSTVDLSTMEKALAELIKVAGGK